LPRVLLIEDDAGVRSAMTRMLKHLGYAVEAVEDGQAGVTAYQRARDNGARFDVVIADLTIPGGMGGREAVAALHGIDPTVRAIVASGYSDDPVLSHPAEFGFAGVIQKPCDMATLGRVVREAMA
jgi:CheY-like chemotaxis protein